MGILSDIGLPHLLVQQGSSLVDDLQLIASNDPFFQLAKYISYDNENGDPEDRLSLIRKIFHSKRFTRLFEGREENLCLESASKLLVNRQCKAVYLKIEKIFLKMTISFERSNSSKFDIFLSDISDVLKLQSSIYHGLIESNFSHEAMTPLNLMINHSETLMNKINSADRSFRQWFDLSKEINQSARGLHFFNLIQITKMKIRADKNILRKNFRRGLEKVVKRVLSVFETQIQRKNIDVKIIEDQDIKRK